MTMTSDIFSVIVLVMDMLKTIQIFPGFSLYMGLLLLFWVTIITWLLGALFGIFNFGGGGGDSE